MSMTELALILILLAIIGWLASKLNQPRPALIGGGTLYPDGMTNGDLFEMLRFAVQYNNVRGGGVRG